MSRDRFDDLLDDWAKGSLSNSEAREFESLLLSHPSWRHEAESHRAFMNLVESAPRPSAPPQLLRTALERARSSDEYPNPYDRVHVVDLDKELEARRARRGSTWGWLYGAAAAALLLAAGIGAWEMINPDARELTVAVAPSSQFADMASEPLPGRARAAKSMGYEVTAVTETVESDAAEEPMSDRERAMELAMARRQSSPQPTMTPAAPGQPAMAGTFLGTAADRYYTDAPSEGTVSMGDVWRAKDGGDRPPIILKDQYAYLANQVASAGGKLLTAKPVAFGLFASHEDLPQDTLKEEARALRGAGTKTGDVVYPTRLIASFDSEMKMRAFFRNIETVPMIVPKEMAGEHNELRATARRDKTILQSLATSIDESVGAGAAGKNAASIETIERPFELDAFQIKSTYDEASGRYLVTVLPEAPVKAAGVAPATSAQRPAASATPVREP